MSRLHAIRSQASSILLCLAALVAADRLAGLPRMTVETGDHGRATTIEVKEAR
jgi:hypothetical protein